MRLLNEDGGDNTVEKRCEYKIRAVHMRVGSEKFSESIEDVVAKTSWKKRNDEVWKGVVILVQNFIWEHVICVFA